MFLNKATLKKKFVSCVAGGPNHGRSGGRKFFFSIIFFCKKITNNFGGRGGGESKIKKKRRSKPAQIFSPDRWTGNKLFLKGGLIPRVPTQVLY